MIAFLSTVFSIVTWLFFIYAISVIAVYTWIALYALGAVLRYRKENTLTDYSIIARTSQAPKFSLVAPAYNEGMTIVENVRSLLSLYYSNLEIIIVNDGSKDDSIEKLIAAYQLKEVRFFVDTQIETQPIKAVYKSTNAAFSKLIVVDKENGGKADALNVGINLSSGDYLVCIDVDCILEQDALLKLAKPFLQATSKRVIACGGVIRLVNNCKIVDGKVVEVRMPTSWLARNQVLEYIRAFVLGRMAWSRASGLILISGAFGAFERQIVVACGGYDPKTVGEDMELVVRMRKYMEEKKEPYEVITIPDPLCWTEAPETKEILARQRNRWMRGTMETLWKHRGLMFNLKYRKLGTISLPYWLTFEFLGPLVEFTGYLVFTLFLILGLINWFIFFILLALVTALGILFSVFAILVDLLSEQVYTKRKDLTRLFVTALVEPIYFHPIVVKAGVQGFVDYFKKRHQWGEMKRQGFSPSSGKTSAWTLLWEKFKFNVKQWAPTGILLFLLFQIGILGEWAWYQYIEPSKEAPHLAVNLWLSNTQFILSFLSLGALVFFLIQMYSDRFSRILLIASSVVLVVLQWILVAYFLESHNLLGADLRYYSIQELEIVALSSGKLSIPYVLGAILILAMLIDLFRKFSLKSTKSASIGIMLIGLGLLSVALPKLSLGSPESEFDQSKSSSKWQYFAFTNWNDYLTRHPELTAWFEPELELNTQTLLDKRYPFWRKENTSDFLSHYFEKSSTPPNLVLIVVEGLGQAYSSPEGYLGDFTPYFSSLTKKGLYWPNTVSSSGRTFAALPTLLGSLPFGENGFLEAPFRAHFNLVNVLGANGFETGFFHGGNAEFDGMKPYLEASGIDRIVDQSLFTNPAEKLPSSLGGESWGYEDQAVFKKLLTEQKVAPPPYFNTVLTLSTHNPFLIRNQAFFETRFEQRISGGALTLEQKERSIHHKKELITVLNFDQALQDFMKEYEKRPDYKNTIFVITGDHSMPEIDLQTTLDRFRVPLLIYSPLIKMGKRFLNPVSHFDLAPTLLAYYKTSYGLSTPSTVTWLGDGLTGEYNPLHSGVGMMQSKFLLQDYLYKNHYVHRDQVYRLKELEPSSEIQGTEKEKILQSFRNYKQRNQQFREGVELLPAKVVENFFQKTK
ncbi:sulfatase-like hydrolase/transferase [Chryseobacterium sp. A301]